MTGYSPDTVLEAQFRALYITASLPKTNTELTAVENQKFQKKFWTVLKYIHDHHDVKLPENAKIYKSSTEDTWSVLQVMEYAINFDRLIPYFRDRDGQCLLHYLAKDKHPEALIDMVKKYHYDPFFRDRSGRCPWDLARPKAGDPGHQHPQINANEKCCIDIPLLEDYITKAYSNSSHKITVVQVNESQDPDHTNRTSPVGFFANDDWKKKLSEKCILKGGDHTAWVHIDVNDVRYKMMVGCTSANMQ